MIGYIIRRLLLIIPTIVGISVVCFALTQFVPGGPVEQAIQKARAGIGDKGASGEKRISEEELQNIKAYFGFDKPPLQRYLTWVWKVCHLDFGVSYEYRKPAWEVIASKMPVSLFFGVTSFILSYLICVPLGVAKARRDGTWFDTSTSVAIFIGYVIPGFALGVLLIVLFGGGTFLNWFPISGIVSDDFESMTFWGKTVDFLHHMVLPLICYMVGEFAFLTLLMKNSTIEEMGKDYVRTAMAKGVPQGTAIWVHAVRNALVPLVTGIGGIFTIMFTGFLLIEKVFDIDGMGMLVYTSIVARDYNVVMALIIIPSVLAALGRLFSDLLYAVVDPRIRFD